MSADALDAERVDPYEVVVANDGSPLAPRLSTAWKAMREVLADGKPHPLEDLMSAAPDLAENSVRQLLKAAVDALRVQTIVDGRAARRGGGRVARKYRLWREVE